MKTIREVFIKYSDWLIIVIISFLAISSLFTSGLPPTHDGEYHVVRFQQFYNVLSEGMIYPRWAPDFNNGFGIPLFNYVYPLPNYVASFFHFLGFSFIDSFKLNMITATLVGSIFMYLWARIYWGRMGGVVSSIFYTFSPYHLVDIYVRGSVGEVWSLAVFPGLLWSFTKFSESSNKVYLILSSVLLAVLIYSHNILALIFFLFFILYSIVISRNMKKSIFIKNLLIVCVIGLGLSAPFWLPALLESRYVQGLQIFDVTKNFPEIYQLIFPSWGYGLSPSDLLNPMSVQIGIANLLVFFISLITFHKSRKRGILLFFILSFVFVFFLMTSYSVFLWKNIPGFSFFQFPWRLLSLEILLTSFIAGSVAFSVKKTKIKITTTIFLIFLAIILNIGYARGATYYKRADSHYLTRSNFTDGTNSVGNVFNTKWLEKVPEKQKEKFSLINGKASIRVISQEAIVYELRIISEGKSDILVNIAYFPGWGYLIDNKHYEAENFNGRILIKIPHGDYRIKIIFQDTLIRKISYFYFFASIILLLYIARRRADIIKR